MSDVFVICNQLGQYWGKKKKWVDGTDPKKIMVCKHEDEAVNLLVELGARDYELRGEVIVPATNDRGIPQVEPSEHLIIDEPEPLPEMDVEREVDAEATGPSGAEAESAAVPAEAGSSPDSDPERS